MPSRKVLKSGAVRWRGRVVFRGRRYEARFTSYDEAKAWEEKTRTSLRSNAWLDPSMGKVTFGEWSEVWLQTRVLKSESTRLQNEGFMTNWILPEFGDFPLAAIRFDMVQAWAVRMISRGRWVEGTDGEKGQWVRLSVSSSRKCVNVLAMALDFAMKSGRIQSNPARGIDLPEAMSGQDHRYLTMGEVTALASAIQERWQALILTGCWAGLRFEELTGLRRSCLLPGTPFSPPRIKVERVITEVGGRLIEKEPKTKSSRREVPISPELAQILEDHCVVWDVGPDDLIFTMVEGGPLRRTRWAKRYLRPAVESSIGGRFTPHDMRHTHVGLLIAQGVHQEVIAELVGHGSSTVTMAVYGGVLPSAAEGAAAALSGAIRESGWGQLGVRPDEVPAQSA